jgi:alpha-methylacyl-CoA racemase
VLRGDAEADAQLGCAVRMSGHAPATPRPAPWPGEHTLEVLREACFDEREIGALRDAGAVG